MKTKIVAAAMLAAAIGAGAWGVTHGATGKEQPRPAVRGAPALVEAGVCECPGLREAAPPPPAAEPACDGHCGCRGPGAD